jgi:hypothetical protein
MMFTPVHARAAMAIGAIVSIKGKSRISESMVVSLFLVVEKNPVQLNRGNCVEVVLKMAVD